MEHDPDLDTVGLFEARYAAFIETLGHLRPRLHRYCARMTGSVFDGEDVMQGALFEAYRNLDRFDDNQPLGPWLFRIAHNRCIDFLRRRSVREKTEAAAAETEPVSQGEPAGADVGHALERLVVSLPPKERACVLLKDVFEHSLEEIAELVGSTIGGVKAALNRGRGKLAVIHEAPKAGRSVDPALFDLLRLYVERFNQGDWDGLRELASADARLRVADCFAGRLVDSPYFVEYERAAFSWRAVLGEVDGEPVMILLRDEGKGWVPSSAVRFAQSEGRISRITDYFKTPWVLGAATSVTTGIA